MSKHDVLIARLTSDETHHASITDWLLGEVLAISQAHPQIGDVKHTYLCKFPTDVARNVAVEAAQKNGADFVVMVDEDCRPAPGFFETAINFLLAKPPCVIASPYCSGDGVVQVFHWRTANNDELRPELMQITREDAAARKNVEQIASIGSHLVAYDVKVFDKIKRPYYAYEYNEDHTALLSTEEIVCHRKLYFSGIPIYCDWDHWSLHRKSRWVSKPVVITHSEMMSLTENRHD